MIGSLMSRMGDAQKLSVQQLHQAVGDGTLPAYIGVPLIQDKMQQQQMAAAPAPQQPPIAQQIMQAASPQAQQMPLQQAMPQAVPQGVPALQSNLPTEHMAGGGIVAFAGGDLVDDEDEDTIEEAEYQQALSEALSNKEHAGLYSALPAGNVENKSVGINPNSTGGVGIKDMLAAKAAQHKLPPELLHKIAGVESNYKATAANPNSSAKGLFQFTDSTWKGMGGKQGEQFDPEKNAELGARFVRQNAEGLKGALGRNPTYGEVYASHMFGLKGAKDLLGLDPKTPMNQAVSSQVLKANPQLQGKTVGQVMASLNAKTGEGIVALADGGQIDGQMDGGIASAAPYYGYAAGGTVKHFGLGGLANSIVGAPVFHAQQAGNTYMQHPEQAALGINTPAEAYVWNNALGTSYSPTVNMYGGPTQADYAEAKQQGVDMSATRVADAVVPSVISGVASAFGGPAAGAAAYYGTQEANKMGNNYEKEQLRQKYYEDPQNFQQTYGNVKGVNSQYASGGEVKHYDGKNESLVEDNSNPYALMGDIGMLTPSYTKDKRSILDKTLRGISLPPEKKPSLTTAPPISTSPTNDDFQKFDQASALFQAEQANKAPAEVKTEAPKEGFDKFLADIESRRAGQTKQKSIDNYMALLQAGLGMMSGTSPHALANIGQGAMAGVQNLSEANKLRAAEQANLDKSQYAGLRYKQLGDIAQNTANLTDAQRKALLLERQRESALKEREYYVGALTQHEKAQLAALKDRFPAGEADPNYQKALAAIYAHPTYQALQQQAYPGLNTSTATGNSNAGWSIVK